MSSRIFRQRLSWYARESGLEDVSDARRLLGMPVTHGSRAADWKSTTGFASRRHTMVTRPAAISPWSKRSACAPITTRPKCDSVHGWGSPTPLVVTGRTLLACGCAVASESSAVQFPISSSLMRRKRPAFLPVRSGSPAPARRYQRRIGAGTSRIRRPSRRAASARRRLPRRPCRVSSRSTHEPARRGRAGGR